MYVCMYVCMHLCVCIYVCMYECMYVCMYVQGTTGGDRDELTADVRNADIQAVIAPNMAKQIVAVQV